MNQIKITNRYAKQVFANDEFQVPITKNARKRHNPRGASIAGGRCGDNGWFYVDFGDQERLTSIRAGWSNIGMRIRQVAADLDPGLQDGPE